MPEMKNIEAYIECQYFASGLKSKLFGSDKRPEYLPAYDSVGLHNEVLLRNDDFVVEIVRRNTGRNLTWLGIYKAAEDKDYGDRGNYCGVGAWLVDCTPVHISILIESLHKLCEVLASGGMNKKFEDSANEFCSDYLAQYLVSDNWIPSILNGIPFARNSYDVNKYIHVNSDKSNSTVNLANSIHANLFSKGQAEYNRYLYIVGTSSKITVGNYSAIETFNDLVKLEHSFATLLSANSMNAIEDNKAVAENGLLRSQIEKSNQIISGLKVDLEKTTESILSLQNEKQDLLTKIKLLGQEKDYLQSKPATQPVSNSLYSGSDKQFDGLKSQVDRLAKIATNLEYVTHKFKQVELPIMHDEITESGPLMPRLLNKKYWKLAFWFFLLIVIALVGVLLYLKLNQPNTNAVYPAVEVNSGIQGATSAQPNINSGGKIPAQNQAEEANSNSDDGYKDMPEDQQSTNLIGER